MGIDSSGNGVVVEALFVVFYLADWWVQYFDGPCCGFVDLMG